MTTGRLPGRNGLATLLVLSSLAVSAQAPLTAPADRWPQFRGSPPLAGTTDARLPPSLKLLWTYEAGDAIESSAAIADNVVYVGSQTGELHAVNLTDGKPRWKYKASADGIGESSPAIAGGLVYVGDLSGVLHAVHADSGKVAWTFKTGSEIKSSPVVAGDKVIVGSYQTRTCTASARKTGSSCGRSALKGTCTRRRRSSTAWRTSRDATRSCGASASRTASRS